MSIAQHHKVETEAGLPQAAQDILVENPEDSLIVLGVSNEIMEKIRIALKSVKPRNSIKPRTVRNSTSGRFFDEDCRYGSEFKGDTIFFMSTDATPGLATKFGNPQPFAAKVLDLKQTKAGIQLVIVTPLSDAAESIDTRFHDPLQEYYSRRSLRTDNTVVKPEVPSVTDIPFHVLSTQDPRNYSTIDLHPFRNRP